MTAPPDKATLPVDDPTADATRFVRPNVPRATTLRQVSHYLIARALLLVGLSLWISIAAINNSTDTHTNSFYLSQMTSMAPIRSDPSTGSGLLWRAVSFPWVGSTLLYIVIAQQFSTAILLWHAALETFLEIKAVLGEPKKL